MLRLNVKTKPELAKMTFDKMFIVYTHHAKEKAYERGVPVLKSLTIKEGAVVECEPFEQKLVVRLKGMLKDYDVVLVVVRSIEGWTCLTTYKNHVNDQHETLNMERVA